MLIVTPVTASVLTVIFIRLSFAVIRLRRANRVGLGSSGNEELERAIRAQGNFAEYVPPGLILIACLELNGASWWLACIPGITLIIGRLIHAKGINEPPPKRPQSCIGHDLYYQHADRIGSVEFSLDGVPVYPFKFLISKV